MIGKKVILIILIDIVLKKKPNHQGLYFARNINNPFMFGLLISSKTPYFHDGFITVCAKLQQSIHIYEITI